MVGQLIAAASRPHIAWDAPAEREQERVLRIRELRRRFDGRDVIASLDVELRTGERLAVTGPNGSGKTTLLRCVSGTLTPTSGAISVCGHPAGTLAARRRVGTSLSQERSFYLRLTGEQNLRFFARLRHRSRRDAARAVAQLIEELEIGRIAAHRVDRCSTGMVQQLALARALLGGPALLVLDEPTRSLDDDAVERFWAAMRRRPTTAVLIATHRPDDIELCDRQIVLAL